MNRKKIDNTMNTQKSSLDKNDKRSYNTNLELERAKQQAKGFQTEFYSDGEDDNNNNNNNVV